MLSGSVTFRISDFDLLVGLTSAFPIHPRSTLSALLRLLIVFARAQTCLFQPLLLLPIVTSELGLVRLLTIIWARSDNLSKSALANSLLHLSILCLLMLGSITALNEFFNVVLDTVACRHYIMSRRGRVQVDVLSSPLDPTFGQVMGHASFAALKCILLLLMIHGDAHLLQPLLQAKLAGAYARCRILLIEVGCDALVPFLDHGGIVESHSFPLCFDFGKTVISVLEIVRRCR